MNNDRIKKRHSDLKHNTRAYLNKMNNTDTTTHVNRTNFQNNSKTEAVLENANVGVVPLWLLICYFVFLAVGACVNFEIVFKLLRTKRNDVFASVLQLAAVDFVSTSIAVAEIWTINNGSWFLSTDLCSFYMGLEVFYNTFVLYFVICTNFHVISNLNLRLFRLEKDDKNPLTTSRSSSSSNDEDESERLMISERHENRNVVIDYRRTITKISICFPSLLVWFICISLSVPQYILSNAIRVNSRCTLCTILDLNYRQLLQNLLAIFQVIVPIPLLLLTFTVLVWKAIRGRFSQRTVARKCKQSEVLLMFGLCLTALYIVTSFPKLILYFLHVLRQEFVEKDSKNFKVLPLEDVCCSRLVNLIVSSLHYGSNTFRALLYVILMPELRDMLQVSRFFVRLRNKS